uniref:Aminotransferase class I/classII large domain-containing protein n=1 Tax=Falco tinnunculus TaxID=100819 RepID=A0A8C4UZ31_FALTI
MPKRHFLFLKDKNVLQLKSRGLNISVESNTCSQCVETYFFLRPPGENTAAASHRRPPRPAAPQQKLVPGASRRAPAAAEPRAAPSALYGRGAGGRPRHAAAAPRGPAAAGPLPRPRRGAGGRLPAGRGGGTLRDPRAARWWAAEDERRPGGRGCRGAPGPGPVCPRRPHRRRRPGAAGRGLRPLRGRPVRSGAQPAGAGGGRARGPGPESCRAGGAGAGGPAGACRPRSGALSSCRPLQGILNLGTSENKLCFDLIEERVSAAGPRPLTGAGRGFDSESDVNFLDCQFSLLEYKEIMAHEKCSFHFLIFLDGYLIPAPYYGGINSKTWLYGGIQPVHVPLFSEVNGFSLKVHKLPRCILASHWFDVVVFTLILINPRNPLGDIYPAQLLKECLEFAHRFEYELHVIMDEIYMLSVYDDTAFTSVLSLEFLILSSTHDFGMSGIRVGVLYTTNQEIRKAVNQLAVFHSCPGPVQHILSQFLRDRDWLDNVFFPTTKKRLKEAQNILVDGLADVGIPILKSSAGLYVWADFRKFLKSQTFEAELELWQKLLDKKLLISPGKAFYCYEPGWFRLVFSDSVDKIYLCKWSLFPSVFPFCRYSET